MKKLYLQPPYQNPGLLIPGYGKIKEFYAGTAIDRIIKAEGPGNILVEIIFIYTIYAVFSTIIITKTRTY